MDQSKRDRLESKGWKVGTASDFLELTPEETVFVEVKLALSRSLKTRRQDLMTQNELASKIGSS
ncbi:hypothetical protein [Phormidesmis sp. 146-33]